MATWQAAEPGTVVGDGQGNYQIRQAGQWTPMPKGSLIADEHGAYYFDSDALKPPPAAKTAAAPATNAAVGGKETTEGPAGFANGLAELVGKGLGNVPMAAVHAIADIASRATGHGGRPESAPTFPLSPNAQSVGQGISDTLGEAAAPYQNPAVNSEFGQNYIAPVANDVMAIAPVAGAAAGVGGAIGDARAAAAAARPAVVTKYGFQTGAENPIARNVAGTSARPAVTAHNQSIADPVLGAQAGVPPGTKITPKALEDARAAPNSVYSRAESSIPTGPLSPNAAAAVQGVGSDDMIVHSPDTQATIDAQKARLLSGPLTGSEVVNGQRALRFNGFRNAGSEDPEQMALGQAQLKMADALHQHMVDTLPPGAPVSAEQLQQARVALAQNHTVENALGPNGNVNLTKLAKIHNDNPGMLSGPMADVAQFASDHPEVTRLPSDAERFNPQGFLHDVMNANVLNRPVGAVAQIFGGKVARGVLTGSKPTLTPKVTGLGGEFAPLGSAEAPAPSAEGITATPLTQSLGDIMPSQRGAVGAPTDISGLRQLMNNRQTYGGGPAVPKTAAEAEIEAILKHLQEQPTTYSGVPLGQAFKP